MVIQEIKDWFTLAIPNPDDKNRAVQLGCHLEEVHELLEAISDRSEDLQGISEYYKRSAEIPSDAVDRNLLLDSLADQIVTAIGIAHMFGMDIQGALSEVSRSNYSKFVNGVPAFNEYGKIIKGPGYTPPDLTNFT